MAAAPRTSEVSLRATSALPSYKAELTLKTHADERWPDELHVQVGAPVAATVTVTTDKTCSNQCCVQSAHIVPLRDANVAGMQRCAYSCFYVPRDAR